jgi:type II restriction enzyme
MARKADLRLLRKDTIINTTSKKQEAEVTLALRDVEAIIRAKYKVHLHWKACWFLREIVGELKHQFPDIDFYFVKNTSSIKPDGGILSIVDEHDKQFPILITEKKNQGTNDARLLEGLLRQSQGNAIERLGKNVIGLRTALLNEGIFPFVCFGDGCDFAKDSSILDRVVTIAMFGHLNKTYLHPQGANREFLRGSFYFREKHWTRNEMRAIMSDIADRSILYYFSKYGKATFIKKHDTVAREVKKRR